MDSNLKKLLYFFWPIFLQSCLAHRKWANGNDYKIALVRRNFWALTFTLLALAIGWWAAFYSMRGWSVVDLFTQAPSLLLLWVAFCLPANIIGSGILSFRGIFAIPDWTKFLDSNERIDWKEFPTANEDTFMIGTTGKDFIEAGWTAPLWERSNYAVVGDLNRGRQNAMNYLLTCGFTANTICFCLDGNPVSNVGFRHLRGIDNIFIADTHATIIRCVKWIKKIMDARLSTQVKSLEPIKFPRILVVTDENVSQTFSPGFVVEKQRMFHWPEIHNDLNTILRGGNACDMHVIAAIEPESTWLEMEEGNRVHLEPVSLYYSLPRQGDGFTSWVAPHEHAYLDVFSIRVGNEKVIGKMPFIDEAEMREWIIKLVAMTNNETKDLWTDSIDRIPKMQISQDLRRETDLVESDSGGFAVVKNLKYKNN